MPSESPYRVLVIANETCPCPALLEEITQRAGAHDPHQVHLVAPALNSRLKHYLSDVDGAVEAARERLGTAVDWLRAEGIAADGIVGDADPFCALTDELHRFAADEILLSTHPPEKSHWLENRLLERVRGEVDIPVEHVVSVYGTSA